MTDRVRENLFNILGPCVEGAVVLDLFAGSGALGLEALSRGAAFCQFVENHPAAIRAIETNVAALRFDQQVRIARRDALRPGPWLTPPEGRPYTLIFADPPYALTHTAEGRKQLAEMAHGLAELGCLAAGALAMLRLKRGVPMDVPWPGFDVTDQRTYGTTTLVLMEFRPCESEIENLKSEISNRSIR